jgi:hypothetical protein
MVTMGFRSAASVAGTATKGMFWWARIFLKMTLLFIAVFFVLVASVSKGIEERDVSVVFLDLGTRFLAVTGSLAEESQKVIDNQGIYDSSKGFFAKIWDGLRNVAGLARAVIFLYIWIKVLGWLFGKSPWSNESQWFVNRSAGFAIFMVTQIVVVVVVAAVSGEITNYFGPEDSVRYYISLPFRSLYLFIQAVPYLLSPIAGVADTITTP